MCDLFYLPFEHGPQSVQYLTEFNWLKSNAYLVSNENLRKSKEKDPTDSKPEVSLLFFEYNKNVGNSFSINISLYNNNKIQISK